MTEKSLQLLSAGFPDHLWIGETQTATLAIYHQKGSQPTLYRLKDDEPKVLVKIKLKDAQDQELRSSNLWSVKCLSPTNSKKGVKKEKKKSNDTNAKDTFEISTTNLAVAIKFTGLPPNAPFRLEFTAISRPNDPIKPFLTPPFRVCQYELQILKQPSQVYYKDDGGFKNNHLQCSVRLLNHKTQKPVKMRDVPFTCRLETENGERLDFMMKPARKKTRRRGRNSKKESSADHSTSASTPKTVKVPYLTIQPLRPEIVGHKGFCQFGIRINDVSQNHHNQKFCVVVEPDWELYPNLSDIWSCKTINIKVKSKSPEKLAIQKNATREVSVSSIPSRRPQRRSKRRSTRLSMPSEESDYVPSDDPDYNPEMDGMPELDDDNDDNECGMDDDGIDIPMSARSSRTLPPPLSDMSTHSNGSIAHAMGLPPSASIHSNHSLESSLVSPHKHRRKRRSLRKRSRGEMESEDTHISGRPKSSTSHSSNVEPMHPTDGDSQPSMYGPTNLNSVPKFQWFPVDVNDPSHLSPECERVLWMRMAFSMLSYREWVSVGYQCSYLDDNKAPGQCLIHDDNKPSGVDPSLVDTDMPGYMIVRCLICGAEGPWTNTHKPKHSDFCALKSLKDNYSLLRRELETMDLWVPDSMVSKPTRVNPTTNPNATLYPWPPQMAPPAFTPDAHAQAAAMAHGLPSSSHPSTQIPMHLAPHLASSLKSGMGPGPPPPPGLPPPGLHPALFPPNLLQHLMPPGMSTGLTPFFQAVAAASQPMLSSIPPNHTSAASSDSTSTAAPNNAAAYRLQQEKIAASVLASAATDAASSTLPTPAHSQPPPIPHSNNSSPPPLIHSPNSSISSLGKHTHQNSTDGAHPHKSSTHRSSTGNSASPSSSSTLHHSSSSKDSRNNGNPDTGHSCSTTMTIPTPSALPDTGGVPSSSAVSNLSFSTSYIASPLYPGHGYPHTAMISPHFAAMYSPMDNPFVSPIPPPTKSPSKGAIDMKHSPNSLPMRLLYSSPTHRHQLPTFTANLPMPFGASVLSPSSGLMSLPPSAADMYSRDEHVSKLLQGTHTAERVASFENSNGSNSSSGTASNTTLSAVPPHPSQNISDAVMTTEHNETMVATNIAVNGEVVMSRNGVRHSPTSSDDTPSPQQSHNSHRTTSADIMQSLPLLSSNASDASDSQLSKQSSNIDHNSVDSGFLIPAPPTKRRKTSQNMISSIVGRSAQQSSNQIST